MISQTITSNRGTTQATGARDKRLICILSVIINPLVAGDKHLVEVCS